MATKLTFSVQLNCAENYPLHFRFVHSQPLPIVPIVAKHNRTHAHMCVSHMSHLQSSTLLLNIEHEKRGETRETKFIGGSGSCSCAEEHLQDEQNEAAPKNVPHTVTVVQSWSALNV